MRRMMLWFCLSLCLIVPYSAYAQSDLAPQITSIAWSPAGTRIAASFADSNVKVWNFSGGTELSSPILTFQPDTADKVEWTPDSKYLVVKGAHNTDAGLVQTQATKWNAATGELTQTLLDYHLDTAFDFSPYLGYTTHPVIGFDSTFTRAAFSFDSRIVRLSDGQSIIFVGNQGDPPQSVYQIMWSPDDTRMAVVYGTEDTYSIQTFEVSSGNRINTIGGQDYGVFDMVWSPDSSQLAVSSVWENLSAPSANVRIFTIKQNNNDLTSEDRAWSFDNTGYAAIAWRPGENRLAIATQTGVQIFDPSSAEPIATLTDEATTAINWSPNGNYLAGGLMDGTIHVWKVPN